MFIYTKSRIFAPVMEQKRAKIRFSTDWHDLIPDTHHADCIHMICLSGDGHFLYNKRPVSFCSGNILVMPRSSEIEALWVSADIEVEILLADESFLHNQLPANHYGIGGSIALYQDPVIAVSEEDAALFRQDILRIKQRLDHTEHHFHDQLLGSMALTMMYDLFEFHAKLHASDQYSDRNTDIVKRLMLLLSTGTTKTKREVGYYADQLGVSMKYLSETVKRQTGNTVMDFIVQYTKPIIIEYLNNPRLSVAQIANALNFTTSNYFTRYCIKHLGMSPTEYRTAHQPKN